MLNLFLLIKSLVNKVVDIILKFYFSLIISSIIIYLAEIGKHNKVSLKNS